MHQGVYPAYISWEQFLRNQARLADNASTFARRARGAPRQGPALLAGLVGCGRCGYLMHVVYKPQHRYACTALAASHGAATCLHVDGASLERVVAGSLSKANRILRLIGFHMHDLNMLPRRTVYHPWGQGNNRLLRFSKSGNQDVENAYATHYGTLMSSCSMRIPASCSTIVAGRWCRKCARCPLWCPRVTSRSMWW